MPNFSTITWIPTTAQYVSHQVPLSHCSSLTPPGLAVEPGGTPPFRPPHATPMHALLCPARCHYVLPHGKYYRPAYQLLTMTTPNTHSDNDNDNDNDKVFHPATWKKSGKFRYQCNIAPLMHSQSIVPSQIDWQPQLHRCPLHLRHLNLEPHLQYAQSPYGVSSMSCKSESNLPSSL